LTVFVHPPGQCETLPDARATVTESDSAVTVGVTGKVAPAGDCSAVLSPVVYVKLDRPLGRRVLRDSTSGLDRPVFRQELLPVIPEGKGGWSPVPSRQSLHDGIPAQWHAAFTKPSGPDVWLDAYLKESEVVQLPPASTRIRLGTRDREIHQRGDIFELVWEDGPCVYSLRLMPAEGQGLTESQSRAVVSSFGWS
jgi:hypothetical protein